MREQVATLNRYVLSLLRCVLSYWGNDALVENARSPRSRRATAPLLVVACLATGSLAVACDGSSAMKRLREEPVAALQLRNAERAVVERPAGETLGKPQPAVLQLVFRPTQGTSVAELLAEAVGSATASGWALMQKTGNVQHAEKTAGACRVELDIYVLPTPAELIVQLTAYC